MSRAGAAVPGIAAVQRVCLATDSGYDLARAGAPGGSRVLPRAMA